jgi:predicted nucleic acid-binding protein
MSQRLVIDASIALAWSLADEGGVRADEALTIVERSGAIVPILWTYEVANSLTHFVQRSRIDTERARTIVAALERLDITRVPPESRSWFRETSDLAIRHSLSVYDAAYLQLALAAGAKLASLDKKLVIAASSEGVAF